MSPTEAKVLKDLLKELKRQGFRVKDKRNGWMIFTPNGQGSVMIHKTETDHRAMKNTVARLRKYGYRE